MNLNRSDRAALVAFAVLATIVAAMLIAGLR